MLRSSKNFRTVRELMLLMHHADHFISGDFERCAIVNSCCRGQAEPGYSRQCGFANKSPEPSNVIVASLPVCETTVSLAGHAADKKQSQPGLPAKEVLTCNQFDNPSPKPACVRKTAGSNVGSISSFTNMEPPWRRSGSAIQAAI